MGNFIIDYLYRPKYRILLLKREHSAFFIVKTITVRKIEKLQRMEKKQYLIDVNSPSYIYQNVFTFIVDIDSGHQMTFHEVERQMTPQELDLIVGTKIIKELTSGVIDNNKEKIFWAIIGVLIGALIGVVIMQNVMASKIEEITSNLPSVGLPTLPTIGTNLKLLWGALKFR